MPFPMYSSLRARLIQLIIVGMMPLYGVMAYHLWAEKNETMATAMEDVQRLTRNIAAEQEQSLHEARNLLQVLASLPEVRDGQGDDCQLRLRAIHGQMTGYLNMGVTDERGRLLCAAQGGGQDFSDRDWYRAAVQSKSFVVGQLVIGRISGQPVIPVAYPILDSAGKLRRIVWASLDVKWLDQTLKLSSRGYDVTVRLLDNQGVVIARQPPSPAMLGRPHNVAWLVESIKAGKTDGVGEARTLEGEVRLITFARLDDSGEGGLYVSASVSKQRVLDGMLTRFRNDLLLLSLFTVLTLAVAWFVTRAVVVRPLSILVRVAKRISAGDLSVRTELGAGHGELSELAHAFDEMAVSLEYSFLRIQSILEVTPEAIIMSDADGRIVLANAHTEKLFGYTRQELIGKPIEILVPAGQRGSHAKNRSGYYPKPVVRDMGAKKLDLKGQRKDGTTFPVDISLGPLKTEQGLWVVAAVRDVSEREQYAAEILHQATHDALTGLPNRTLFHEFLVHGMAQARRAESLLAVLFLDLDGFKNINDTLGHAAGDELLRTVAKRIVDALRKGDVVARQGGDEFTIQLQDIKEAQDITLIADKLMEAIAKPYYAGSHEFHITASIGITVFPLDDNDADSLLRNADTAMYQAKADGKNAFRFYTAEMNATMCARLETENGLRKALQDEQFVLHYQPQVSVETGKILGVEALIRWQHPTQGLLAPATFISIAEESGLIEPIGEWVLTTACRQIQTWRAMGLGDIKVAVNLSARQFHRPNLLNEIRHILIETHVDACPWLLELELTESMMMRDMEKNVVTLRRLREMGVLLSIDDFGTGYSSLSYLKRFPITMLKIDQSFVKGVTTDEEDAAITMAIVTLGHSLKLKVIAEGVETEAQWNWLRESGCDEAQGYHFGRPIPAEMLEALLRAGNPLPEPAGG